MMDTVAALFAIAAAAIRKGKACYGLGTRCQGLIQQTDFPSTFIVNLQGKR